VEGPYISDRELGAIVERISDKVPTMQPDRAQDRDRVPVLDRIERDYILGVLRQVGGNRMAAAKLLGITRRAFYRRLARHGITNMTNITE
jgi:transcriptional regulator of acetoin/glycerol metabolism